MATTTRTTRKKPARAASASRATKTRKTAGRPKKTSSAKAAVSSNAKKALTPMERLRSIHISLTFMYVVFAVLVGVFVKMASVPVGLAISTRDEFAAGNSVTLGAAHEVLYSIEPKYVLVASLVVGALASLLFATKLRNRYEIAIGSGVSNLRWVAVGLSSSLLLTFVNMSAGINDFATLKLSGAFILATVAFAWLADRENAGNRNKVWGAYVLSLFAGALAWLPLVGTFIGTPLYGMERFGWQVYAFTAATLIGFIMFAFNQYLQFKQGRDYVVVEEAFLRTDMLTKFAVVLIALLALK